MVLSSSQSKYEAFLSFRGEDTRNGFTSHLAAALHRKQIQFFIDDEELKKGDEISPALSNAIESSDISIIIFSKGYASSRWCLNELVKILDCKKMNAQIVIPVFYQVDPSDVRKQRGSFGEAFVNHDNNFPGKVQKWRHALTEASNLSGYDSTESRNDAELVEKIVEDISKKLEDMSESTDLDDLVGLNTRIEEMKSLLCLESQDVRIVGIWGMGGIGKTTIASVVFHQISRHFQGMCFMANVREKANKMGVIHVRDEVISQVLGENLKIGTLIVPQNIKKRLQRVKVLIVLDDVNDEFTQLESLAGGVDRFSPGSRIVITTRDKQVLDKCGVSYIYKVKRLEHDNALELFCRKAIRQNSRSQDLLELSKEVVGYAKGNPLALEVLGSSLYQKSKQQWKVKLQNLKLISEPNIYNVLKISYDDLNPEEKKIFLDIACFFKGEDADFVTRIQDDPTSLDNIVDKSLITISDENRLQMHDLLQEMGQTIVRQKSISKRTRLWDHEDIYHVLKKNKGTEKIEGIFLDLSKTKDIHLSSQAFANMSNLRLLKFYMPERGGVPIMSSKVHLDQGLEDLPEKLRYLHWHGYPLKTLPFDFELENLIELRLPYSKVEQIWEGKKKAFKLKSIDLCHSQHLIRMPDLSEIPNLERTNFFNCTNLVLVPSSIQNFNNLSMLCFRGCESLTSFPRDIHFVSPVTIDFSFCVNLTEFPKISGKITELNLCDTAIEEVPSSVECLTNLKELYLSRCSTLNRLSTSICKLKSLHELILSDCLSLESFPEILEKMEHLKYISLYNTAITELPSSFANLEGLEKLVLVGCSKLNKLPHSIGNLKSLVHFLASGSALSQLPASVGDLNEFKLTSFSRCRGLSSLVDIDLSNCAVVEILEDVCCLSSLQWLDLSGNNFESLPSSIKQLSQLRKLDLSNCNMLLSLPELPLFLEDLEARNCKRLQFLPEIPSCLEELDASMLEKPPKTSHVDEFWTEEMLSIKFKFTNCLKLNEKAYNKILADSKLTIQRMAIASLRLFDEKELSIFVPGSEIPDWFSNQSSGSSITLQLPQHSFGNLIGFALCAVIEFKQLSSNSWSYFNVGCRYSCEINKISAKDVYLAGIIDFIDSDHVILGFKPCGNDELPDANYHTDVSFQFFPDGYGSSYKVKCCGVCPVYADSKETKSNTFTLKFAAGSKEECTEIRKLDDQASTIGASASVGKSDEEELERSPKRICRGQINNPQ